jgi:hypothetical protein
LGRERENIRGLKEEGHDKDLVPVQPGSFYRFVPVDGRNHQLDEKRAQCPGFGRQDDSDPRGEEITMLEFWCIAIFAGLSASSIWLIYALDELMESEP